MNLIERRREMAGLIGEKPPTLIPYIRGGGSGGSYIDTGITADNTVRVVIWARNFNQAGSSFNWLFGSRTSQNVDMFDLPLGANTLTGGMYFSFETTLTLVADCWRYCSGYHKYDVSANGLFVDDIMLNAGSSATFSNSFPIHLFGFNSGGSHTGSPLPADICACKIYKNNVLVRDYTPVSSPSVGLYDAVSDTIFTNAGNGTLAYGEFAENAFDQLERVYTSAANFLTPIIGSYRLPIVVAFMATATTKNWFDVLGGRDGTNRCQIFTGNTSYSNCQLAAIIGTGTAQRMKNTSKAGETRNKKFAVVKQNNKFTAYYNKATYGSAITYSISTTYSTGIRIGVGATNNNGSWNNQFVGNIYFVGFGASCNLVPAVVDNVTGMYDTYNDVFYSSVSSTPFVRGGFSVPHYEYGDGMQIVRHWEGRDGAEGGRWYERVNNKYISLTSVTQEDNYYQVTNASSTSATSYGTFNEVFPDLGYHWKVVADIAVKYNSSDDQIALDFGSVQATNDGTQAFEIGITSAKKWTFNTKFNGNTATTYAPDATNLTETDISDGDWVRRTVTIGVRASETEGMDETYAIVEGLGTGVSAPFTPINFNNWMTGWYIGRSAITPDSSHPYASNARIYSLKVYKEI